jgi:hypothetical protein
MNITLNEIPDHNGAFHATERNKVAQIINAQSRDWPNWRAQQRG